MEFTFTLRYLQGSVVPIVTTQATALGTPLNAAPAPPSEVTQTLNQPLPQQQQQRSRSVERVRRNWQGGYRGWRDGNRGWQGDNRRWQGDNRRRWYDRDHDSRRRGSGGAGDQSERRGGGDVSGRKGGGDVSNSRGGLRKHEGGGVDVSGRKGGGDVSNSRGGLRKHEGGGVDVSGRKGGGDVSNSRRGLRKHEGGVGTGRKQNSCRNNGEASSSIIAIDRVPVADVPSTSGCDNDDGERRNSAFKGQCSKCYEEGHRRKDCPYQVTYRLLTSSEVELARTEDLSTSV